MGLNQLLLFCNSSALKSVSLRHLIVLSVLDLLIKGLDFAAVLLSEALSLVLLLVTETDEVEIVFDIIIPQKYRSGIMLIDGQILTFSI